MKLRTIYRRWKRRWVKSKRLRLYGLLSDLHTYEERMAFFLLNPEAQAMFPASYSAAHDWMRDHYPWEPKEETRKYFQLTKEHENGRHSE